VRTEFVHLADVHLGTVQYGAAERYNDFARAFLDVVDQAVRRRVQFVLIAGDLFDKFSLEPRTLAQAVDGLQALKRAGIRVFAIEGNHDRANYRQDTSWLQYLAWQELLTRLDVEVREGTPRVVPYDRGKGGTYVDLDGVRILGLRYVGAMTPRVIEQIAPQLDDLPPAAFTICMGHFGMEGVLPQVTGGLSYAQVQPLERRVDYLALGHIHKRYERNGWIYNPGSTETWRMDEANWPRGFYHVAVDTAATPMVSAEHVENKRRPFLVIDLPVQGLRSPDELYEVAHRTLEDRAGRVGRAQERPVVVLVLQKELQFDRQALDRDKLEDLMRAALNPLVVQVRDYTVARHFEPSQDDRGEARAVLELGVFRDLLSNDERYRPLADDWARLVQDTKRLVLEGDAPEKVIEHLRLRRQELLQRQSSPAPALPGSE
jgi:DNA repair exonuclease SbcCD nuclease subunit